MKKTDNKIKIVHINLCGLVTDGLQYQDNLLPKYHKKMGMDTYMITSQYSQDQFGARKKVTKTNYLNENNVLTYRLKEWSPTRLSNKFKIYPRLYNKISSIGPDILFVHGVQFLNLLTIRKYISNNPKVFLYIDNHADFSNSAKNRFSYYILHRIIWRLNTKIISKKVIKFYGVLPSRVEFLINVYNAPKEKVELLRLGSDDEKIIYLNKTEKTNLLNNLNLKPNMKTIVTGGKFDETKKEINFLVEAIKKNPNFQLIIFGSISNYIIQVLKLEESDRISFVGWIDSKKAYKYFALADIIAFPGRHSVLWENAFVFKKPMILKYWEGTDHLNLNDNIIFIKDSSQESYTKLLGKLADDKFYQQLKKTSQNLDVSKYLYSTIAQDSIKEYLYEYS